MRKQTSRHVHKKTPKKGLIRLGTYIEVTEELWRQFKKGEGAWECCGETWRRPDFPKRSYFLITRGLREQSFYERVAADRYCVNIQVSTDILERDPEKNKNLEFYIDSGMAETLPTGKVLIPSRQKLLFFLKYPKVMFRFKTLTSNAGDFIALQRELGIPKYRIMETPLRTAKEPHVYQTETYLEKAGWDAHEFGRCNTRCEDCKHENGMLLCAARGEILPILPKTPRAPPPRYDVLHLRLPRGKQWKSEAARCMLAHGGSCTVQQAYAWFLKDYPILAHGKPGWQFKVRVALQRAGMRVCEFCGAEHRRPPYVRGVKPAPVTSCSSCGTRLRPVWTVRPELRPREAEVRPMQTELEAPEITG
ncbi:MAG: hypothetical protein LYZ70_04205 [Nitrososphaerales archaeon]|nr:hypothetical protein [Nitrososphaerales archaeon]